MTKKKSILLQVLFLLFVCGIVIGVLMLTGCGDELDDGGEYSETSVVEFNGDEYFATSDIGNITNQEAFDLMLANPSAVFIVLNLVDEILLRGNFEIDEANTVGFWEEFKAEIPDVDEWMSHNGFASEEEVLNVLELEELRASAARHLVEITDEEVEEVFEMWFDAEVDDIEDVRDEIYDSLVADAVREVSMQEVARLRYEAELIFFNETLAAAYEDYLEMGWVTDIDLHEATSPDSADVIARIDGVDITVDQVFAALSAQLGLEIAFEYLDEMIIAANFSVDPAEVDEMIEEYREEFGDDFDEIIADAGFESEEALFDHLERILLDEVILSEHFAPSEERLRELYDAMGDTVSGSHILVEDYDTAVDLIERLQDTDDFSEVFAELAAEYSSCPSGESGGDLGSWSRGQMVEEFDDAIFDLEVGEFTDAPVETQFGYHIIYKTGEADVPEFEDVREELIAQEMAQLQQMPGGAINEVLMNFRHEAELEFTNPELQTRFEFLVNVEW
jgi:parvulin-like peptidyl-prolyl isomerase